MTVGSRILQARELRGFTQTELAQKVGVTQGAIAKFEKDLRDPSEETLRTIAFVTGFPVGFFRRTGIPDFPLGSHLVFFRARATLTWREQAQAHRYAEIIHEGLSRLGKNLTSIPVLLPQKPGEDPAKAANITRAVLGLSPDKPIENLILTIERGGVRVIALPLSNQRLDSFSLWMDEAPVLAVLAGWPGDRGRWNVAHEVGHLVLHRTASGSLKEIECAAHRFAAELLLPTKAMREEILPPVTLYDLVLLKPRWKVSIQALAKRAFDLEIVTENQYRWLFQQIGSRGWKRKEPDDLAVTEERPRLFKKMVEVLYQKPSSQLDVRKIAEDLAWTQEFTREVLSVHADRNGAFASTVTPKGGNGGVLNFPKS